MLEKHLENQVLLGEKKKNKTYDREKGESQMYEVIDQRYTG